MKKNRIFGLASGLALLLAGACSNDMLDGGKEPGQLTPGTGAGDVYMTVDFQMPSGSLGTRSETDTPEGGDQTTSSGGTEIGTDVENYVSSALIVIASSEEKRDDKGNIVLNKYGYIIAGEVPGNRLSTSTSSESGNLNKYYRAIAQIEKENLNTFYGLYESKDLEGKVTYNVPDVYVFVFCNPTKDLLDVFNGDNTQFGKDTWLNETCEVKQSVDQSSNTNVGIWSSNAFLMNNVKLTTRALPENLLDWEYYSSSTSAFQLSGDNKGVIGPTTQVDNSSTGEYKDRGSVLVERSVARFDFKDGSKKADGTPNNNTYSVLYNLNKDGDIDNAQPVVDIQIQKMCLVNMSNSFYYLPRVSDNGLPTGDQFQYCGPERAWIRSGNTYSGGNYVVGPYATQFGGEAIMTGFDTYMNFPFFDNNGSFNNETMSTDVWDVVKVSDVLKNGTPDQYTGTADKPATAGEYKVWRYVTENVIPVNQGKQLNGISTGVVFKGKLLGNSKITQAAVTDGSYYEENWEAGSLLNLANCLNGKAFKYNGVDHDKLVGNSKEDPILYYFGGKLYFGWRHLRQAAIQASVTINANGQQEINVSNALYKVVFGDGPIPATYHLEVDGKMVEKTTSYVTADNKEIPVVDPRWTEELANAAKNYTTPLEKKDLENITDDNLLGYLQSPNFAWSEWADGGKEIIEDGHVSDKLAAMREAVTGAGITIYQSSVDNDAEFGPGYYCYYYYWNRHNDNGMDGSMGPMEFAVVRNNVYKLSIDRISRLGHPRIPENDPDNPKPEDPDESDEIYLSVRVQIAPWLVRVNGIKF